MISLLNVYLVASIGLFVTTAFNRYSLYDNYFAFALSYWADPMTNAILYNFWLACMILFQKLIAIMVFGQIKQNEKTKILQKLKLKSLQILFMAVILHDQFTFPVFALALGLVVSFVLHHLTVLRSQYLINTHNLYLNQHVRLLIFYLVVLFVDFEILKHSWNWIIAQNNMSIVFSFYVLQLFLLLFEPCVKFTIYLYERFTGYQFNELDAKLNIIGLVINLPRLILLNILGIYIMIKFRFSFFFVFMIIQLIVELFQLLRNFSKVRGLGKMMQSLPKINREQIEKQKMDDTCMICFRQIYQGVEVPSCNHIFHNECLKQWIHKNTNHFCPKCKKPFNFPQNKADENGQVNNRQQQRNNQAGLEQPEANPVERNNQQVQQEWRQVISKLKNRANQAEENRLNQQGQPIQNRWNPRNFDPNFDIEQMQRQIQQPKMMNINRRESRNNETTYKSNSKQKSNNNHFRVGSVPFGLPHEAIYYRKKQDFRQRDQFLTLNKTISSLLDCNHYKQMLLINQN